MTVITIKNRSFTVATAWNELSEHQLLQIVRLVYGNFSLSWAYMMMLRSMAQVPIPFWNGCQWKDIEEYLYLPAELLEKSRLTDQLLQRQGIFVGPASNFNNLVMCEFVFTEDYFFRYKDGNDPASLDNLCAVLFRPVKKGYDTKVNPDGDAREPFNENKCLYRARRVVRKWDPKIKLAILTWYEHCRLQIVDDFPAVFAAGEGDPAKYGLITMMRNVAQAGTHGNFEKVEHLPLKMVMIELDEVIAEADRIKRMTPKTS